MLRTESNPRAVTAAAATPHVMRDRLLRAIDGQSNICNMAVVKEVISVLEEYPITKDALEDTRLGKIINDVRKKTNNEDLAKRAKKLLRNWQKFIEPGEGELLSRGFIAAPWSFSGNTHPCISPPASFPSSGKRIPELKPRSDFNNCTPSVETTGNRKHKWDQKEGQLVQAKKLQTIFDGKIQNSKQMPTNGLNGCTKIVTDIHTHHPLDGETSQPSDNNKLNKIPIHAVKSYQRAPKCKHLNTSGLFKASALQQPVTQSASGGQYRPKNTQCFWPNTGTQKQETRVKTVVAQTQNIYSPSVRARMGGTQSNGSSSADLESQSRSFRQSHHNSTTSSCCEAVSLDDEGPANKTSKSKRQKYRPTDYGVNLDGLIVEGHTKPLRLKDRQITFDPVTGQNKPSYHEDSFYNGDVSVDHRPKIPLSGQLKQNQSLPSSLFQQTDWKESSKSELSHSYLSQQSNLLTISGVRAPRAQTELLKKEEHWFKDANKTDDFSSDHPPKELPGVSREIRNEDLKRLHMQRWSGVNGCYDTKGNWYDWTECISIDKHGEESRLNIRPYVCLENI